MRDGFVSFSDTLFMTARADDAARAAARNGAAARFC